jgi:hypothetical protein
MATIKSFFSGKTISEAEALVSEKEAGEYVRSVVEYLGSVSDPKDKNLFSDIISNALTPAQKMKRNAILAKRRNPDAY